VVDDNPDGTGHLTDELASHEPRVHVLHRMSKDVARAYIAGFQWALQHDYDFVFEMDADFRTTRSPRFSVQIQNADLVLGSLQAGSTSSTGPSPGCSSLGANAYARWIGLPLSDATGGFKCFRRKVLEAIDLEAVRSNGYAFQIEMSFRAWRKGFRLVELPIVFTDRVEGTSKMSKRIVREAIWMVWWLRFQGMLGKT
jgi:dolichol-phosphate mannosyltransferase